MTCKTVSIFCQGAPHRAFMDRYFSPSGWCQCRPEGPTWCQGGEPWTPARVADLTWGRMHL